MKKFSSRTKNILYLGYRIVSPVVDPINIVKGLYGYIWYLRDLIKYKLQGTDENIRFIDIFPSLHDKSSLTPFDAHYFYQQLWVFEEVLKRKPKNHVDIASTYQMSGYLSKIVPTTFIDIRPIDTKLDNLSIINGSILSLPLDDLSVSSLSCLHVLEHIGLGRYGDEVDVGGTKKAVKEISRVVKQGGLLYFTTPVGIPRVCFNSHKVFSPKHIVDLFKKFKLLEFHYVDDNGVLIKDCKPKDAGNQNYACGFFLFEKL